MPFEFVNINFLWLLNLIPLCIAWYVWKHRSQQPSILLSSTNTLKRESSFSLTTLQHLLFVLRMIAILFLCVALARPQQSFSIKSVNSEGIDIMLVMDVSGSMMQKDFKPNRMEAAKVVLDSFIARRPNDRIGLVLFASQAYTACPITIDHRVLQNILMGVKVSDIANGTAIGMGLGTAVGHLYETKGKSKTIILVTDGENNMGKIKPVTAGQLALAAGIRVYTIGIQIPPLHAATSQDSLQNSFSNGGEGLLMQVAAQTNGKYFRAENEKALATIYDEINHLEKTKVDVTVFQRNEEYFFLFALIAALAILLELFLRYSFLKTFP